MTILPITTKFELRSEISEAQQLFLETYGFLHFENVLSKTEVDTILSEVDRVEQELLDSKRDRINGVPVYRGLREDGREALFRIPFTTMLSEEIKNIVVHERFQVLLPLVAEDARIGHDEKDGVVINRYANEKGAGRPRLGWHTDALRCLFYGRMPQPMLNFGFHLTDCPKEQGGLRLIPGTHKQAFKDFFFYKPYFISHSTDPDEIAVETKAGDLTVHDGRLWHRVERSTFKGESSVRRSMFLPLQSGPREPKNEHSTTPQYHYLSLLQFGVRRAMQRLRLRTSSAIR